MSATHNVLKDVFKETGAFKLAPPGEPFTLASGKKSNYYVDCRKVLLKPHGNRIAVFAMSGLITDYLREKGKPDASLCIGATGVGGAPLLGGILFSLGAVSRHSGFVVRDVKKEHGLKRQVEGHVDKDSQIIFIDDVLTTGGSVLQAAGALQEACDVLPHAIMILVDREEGGAEALKKELGCEVRSLLKVSDFRVGQPATTM